MSYKYLDQTGLTHFWSKIKAKLDLKQDELTAGTNITIDANNVISASGGGGVDLNTVYPVGSIYMSVNNTNPATLFGVGTWEQLQDRFLLGAGSTYTAGNTGGEATHQLTVDEMPSHNHSYEDYYASSSSQKTWDINKTANSVTSVWNSHTSRTSGNKGGGQAHNNMPPYLVVYMWKRTA